MRTALSYEDLRNLPCGEQDDCTCEDTFNCPIHGDHALEEQKRNENTFWYISKVADAEDTGHGRAIYALRSSHNDTILGVFDSSTLAEEQKRVRDMNYHKDHA